MKMGEQMELFPRTLSGNERKTKRDQALLGANASPAHSERMSTSVDTPAVAHRADQPANLPLDPVGRHKSEPICEPFTDTCTRASFFGDGCPPSGRVQICTLSSDDSDAAQDRGEASKGGRSKTATAPSRWTRPRSVRPTRSEHLGNSPDRRTVQRGVSDGNGVTSEDTGLAALPSGISSRCDRASGSVGSLRSERSDTRVTSAPVPFPAHRQVGLVRKVARAIVGRPEHLGRRYWQTEARRLAGRLESQGFPPGVIEIEAQRFAMAVSEEIGRLVDSLNHGGAA